MIVEELKTSGELSSNELAFRLGYQKLTEDVSGAVKELMEDGIVEYSNTLILANPEAANKQ